MLDLAHEAVLVAYDVLRYGMVVAVYWRAVDDFTQWLG